jgi:hypothetical protein
MKAAYAMSWKRTVLTAPLASFTYAFLNLLFAGITLGFLIARHEANL